MEGVIGMKRKTEKNNRSVVFKRLEEIGDTTNVQGYDTININIEIDEKGLAGYEFLVDGKSMLWENMDRKQQISVLNSFMQGYVLFKKFFKNE